MSVSLLGFFGEGTRETLRHYPSMPTIRENRLSTCPPRTPEAGDYYEAFELLKLVFLSQRGGGVSAAQFSFESNSSSRN